MGAIRNRRHREADLAGIYGASVEAELPTAYIPKKTSRNGAVIFKIALFITSCTLVMAVSYFVFSYLGLETIVAMALVSLIVLSSIHIALNWEKVVILRFGKLNRVVGPGLFLTIPVIEHGTIRVDQRITVTPFAAEKTLTVDLVPVNIDAVLYWLVWDAEKACTEVEDYFAAVSFLAQTAMREAIGRSTVAEVALRRDQLDAEIKGAIEKEAATWGVDIISVKVRDIVLPDELQEAMSLEAQAEREKNARMTLAAIETDIAEILAEAAKSYACPDAALKLRTMLVLYETVKKSKGTVVTIPSSISDGSSDSTVEKLLTTLRP
ncbi:MAG: slipin family protein [Coriobacteriaceae bacterium]|jgi:regulator of protease activity HflC (stomatin/prohibitin superfamily)|nr:slipin family protein [Coriobacteriaceae bacterium]